MENGADSNVAKLPQKYLHRSKTTLLESKTCAAGLRLTRNPAHTLQFASNSTRDHSVEDFPGIEDNDVRFAQLQGDT